MGRCTAQLRPARCVTRGRGSHLAAARLAAELAQALAQPRQLGAPRPRALLARMLRGRSIRARAARAASRAAGPCGAPLQLPPQVLRGPGASLSPKFSLRASRRAFRAELRTAACLQARAARTGRASIRTTLASQVRPERGRLRAVRRAPYWRARRRPGASAGRAPPPGPPRRRPPPAGRAPSARAPRPAGSGASLQPQQSCGVRWAASLCRATQLGNEPQRRNAMSGASTAARQGPMSAHALHLAAWSAESKHACLQPGQHRTSAPQLIM